MAPILVSPLLVPAHAAAPRFLGKTPLPAQRFGKLLEGPTGGAAAKPTPVFWGAGPWSCLLYPHPLCSARSTSCLGEALPPSASWSPWIFPNIPRRYQEKKTHAEFLQQVLGNGLFLPFPLPPRLPFSFVLLLGNEGGCS